jgi:hypothetical protein
MPEQVWARVQRWLHRTLEDLICVRDHGDACIRSRPSTLVIGQNDLYPWARGVVWDFRGGGCAALRPPPGAHAQCALPSPKAS